MKKLVVFLSALLIGLSQINAQISFAPYLNFPISGTSTDHVCIGDLNHDGRKDVLVVTGFNFSTFDYKVMVYKQDTGGHLMLPVSYSYRVTYPGARGAAVGDVDGDGKDDVVLGVGDSIAVFLQTTSGVLGAETRYWCNSGVNDIDAVRIYDVDGDGRKDIITVSWLGPVVVFYNTPAGLVRVLYPTAVGVGWDHLAVGKVGTDTLVSILKMGGQGYSPIKQLRIHSDRSVDTTITRTATTGVNFGGVGLADLYGTGHKIIGAVFGSNVPASHAAVWRNSSATVADTILNVADIPGCIAVGRLGCSAREQLVAVNQGANSVNVIDMVTGVSRFSIPCSNMASSSCVAVGDINGDGKPDIVVGNTYSGMSVLYNTSMLVDTTVSVTSSFRLNTVAVDSSVFHLHDSSGTVCARIHRVDTGRAIAYAVDSIIIVDTLHTITAICGGVTTTFFHSFDTLHFVSGIVSVDSVNRWVHLDTLLDHHYDSVRVVLVVPLSYDTVATLTPYHTRDSINVDCSTYLIKVDSGSQRVRLVRPIVHNDTNVYLISSCWGDTSFAFTSIHSDTAATGVSYIDSIPEVRVDTFIRVLLDTTYPVVHTVVPTLSVDSVSYTTHDSSLCALGMAYVTDSALAYEYIHDTLFTMDSSVHVVNHCTGLVVLDTTYVSTYTTHSIVRDTVHQYHYDTVVKHTEVVILEHQNPRIVMYPNPTTSMLHIDVSDNLGSFSVIVRASNGQLISTTLYDSSVHSCSLDMSMYSSGVYFITLQNNFGFVWNEGVSKE